MREYDSTSGMADTKYGNSAIEEIINCNFTYDEIDSAIEFLESNKSPGIDNIPVEFIKACKSTLTQPIMVALNYIIEARDFPSIWASGLRSAVFKNGKRDQVDHFWGITILPIIENIFEIVVYIRDLRSLMKLSIQPTGIMADSSVATARLTIYLY